MPRNRLRAACALACLALLSAPTQADPATERYAPHQLRVAEVELELAEEAVARGDLEAAGRLALQAQTDARLAWAMSDSERLRAAASEVYEESRRLQRRVTRP